MNRPTARSGRRVDAAVALYALSAVLAPAWIWLAFGSSRGEAIAWEAGSVVIGLLWIVAGSLLARNARRAPAARWLGGVTILVGVGLLGLAVAMLPITYESTWAV